MREESSCPIVVFKILFPIFFPLCSSNSGEKCSSIVVVRTSTLFRMIRRMDEVCHIFIVLLLKQ